MSNIIVTLDVDWAPDFVIDFVAEQLIKHSVKATWFITHTSSAVDRLRQEPELFELGIHPNFLAGSTHGDTPKQVLRHCMTLVPEARSVRMHSLVQSTPLLDQILTQTVITTDVSLFLPHMPSLRPVEYYCRGCMLLRIPYFWEDDFEMERPAPCWYLSSLLDSDNGLKVFDFHPIHIYLNSANMKPYQSFKRRVMNMQKATSVHVREYVQTKMGTQTFFLELIGHLASTKQSLQIREISERWKPVKQVE